MAKHFVDSENPKRSSRSIPWVGFVAVLLIAALALAVGVHWKRGQKSQGEETPSAGEPSVEVVSAVDGDSNSELPFRVDGVSGAADLVKVSEGAVEAQLGNEWLFGGDYSEIGSFPIDGDHVFGSSSDTPDDLSSYCAAVITRDGAEGIAPVSVVNGTYFEPRDGSRFEDGIVWQSGSLNDYINVGVNNWQLSYWNSSTNESRVLGSAEELNGRDDTPALMGEVQPTLNATKAYYASAVTADNDSWSVMTLEYDLRSKGAPRIVGVGSYPAATEEGVLFASDPTGDGVYSSVRFSRSGDSNDAEKILSVSSEDGSWGVSGIWACGSYRAVAFSSSSEGSSTYLGLWKSGFGSPLVWLRIDSPTVVASMNDDWVVWGSGSQLLESGMFAYRWEDGKMLYLGSAEGYSRPTIASDSNAVLVPVYNGDAAVKFRVGMLQ